jgi:phosphoribosylglycinamide formyltransferase 1
LISTRRHGDPGEQGIRHPEFIILVSSVNSVSPCFILFLNYFMPQSTSKPFRIAVLISGGGTTLKNLLEKIDAGRLTVDISLVIASTPKAGGLKFAREESIPALVLEMKCFSDTEAYSDEIFAKCRDHETDLVVMGGFLKRLAIPPDFMNRIVNIHPGLIPAFCGQGFYGHRVHEAVLEYGAKVSGCTVHFADNEYDHGPVILQKAVPVLDDDTPDSLAARVFEAECEAYPEAIQLIAEGRVRLEGRKVRVLPRCSDAI